MSPAVPSDIDIAQAAKPRPIADVAAEVGLTPAEILPYGHTKAKITMAAIRARKPTGRLQPKLTRCTRGQLRLVVRKSETSNIGGKGCNLNRQ